MSTSENLFQNSYTVYIDCIAFAVHFYFNNQETMLNMLIIIQQIKQRERERADISFIKRVEDIKFTTTESLSFSLDC